MLQEFNQEELKNVLIKLSGNELNHVSGEVTIKTKDQLAIVKNSIAGFNDIITNVDLVNKDVHSIQINMDNVSTHSDACSK